MAYKVNVIMLRLYQFMYCFSTSYCKRIGYKDIFEDLLICLLIAKVLLVSLAENDSKLLN